jgi:hypothetical protein
MSRLRLFRRRHEDDATLPPPAVDDALEEGEPVPFVPVSGRRDYDEDYYAGREFDDTDDAAAEDAVGPDTLEPMRRGRRLPRLRAPQVPHARVSLRIRWGMLLLAALLIVGGIFGTLLNQDRLKREVVEWWPALVIALAVLWMILALARRRIASFLGAMAVAGVGLSLLMNTQDIAAFEETLMGVVLITLGLGIVIRGFLLRQQSPI